MSVKLILVKVDKNGQNYSFTADTFSPRDSWDFYLLLGLCCMIAYNIEIISCFIKGLITWNWTFHTSCLLPAENVKGIQFLCTKISLYTRILNTWVGPRKGFLDPPPNPQPPLQNLTKLFHSKHICYQACTQAI